jgi:hypothetical protein
MVDLSNVNGRCLAMIAWGKTADGEKDVAVFSGIAVWDGSVLTMRREPETASFAIPAEWYARLRPVEAGLKEMLLGADYCFSVSVGNLDEEDDSSGFRNTGLTWPSRDGAG